MAVFVHLCDINNQKSVLRNGIKLSVIHYPEIKSGVFCMPVTPDYYSSHQWLREIKYQHHSGEIIAVYFTVPNNEIVYYGKYTDPMISGTVKSAFECFRKLDDKMGFQIIIPRKILFKEIKSVKRIPQITGWKYYPKAHGKKLCLCPACIAKGSFNSNNTKLKKRTELIQKIKNINNIKEIPLILSEIGDIQTNTCLSKNEQDILFSLFDSLNENNKGVFFSTLTNLLKGRIDKQLFDTLYSTKSYEMKETCINTIFCNYSLDIIRSIEKSTQDKDIIHLIDEYKQNYC